MTRRAGWLMLFVTVTVVTAAPPVKVFVVAGQSNQKMGIYSHFDGSQTWFASPVNDCLWHYWSEGGASSNGNWEKLRALGTSANIYGLEHVFAYYVTPWLKAHDPSNRLAFIRVMQGSTSLNNAWNPGGRADTTTAWTEKALHKTFRERVTMALNQLPANGITNYELAGFLWYQGEGDCYSGGTGVGTGGRNYAILLNDLINDWTNRGHAADMQTNYTGGLRSGFIDPATQQRTTTNGPRAQCLLARVSWHIKGTQPTWGPRENWETNVILVRKALTDFARTDTPLTSKWIDVDDVPLVDNYHYDSAGYLVIYKRFVSAWFNAATNGNLPPGTPTHYLPTNGMALATLTPTLSLYPFVDPDRGDTETAAQWQISTNDSFSAVLWDSYPDTVNLTSLDVPGGALPSAGTYYWRVRHLDSRGAWSPYSMGISFTGVPEPALLAGVLAVLLVRQP